MPEPYFEFADTLFWQSFSSGDRFGYIRIGLIKKTFVSCLMGFAKKYFKMKKISMDEFLV